MPPATAKTRVSNRDRMARPSPLGHLCHVARPLHTYHNLIRQQLGRSNWLLLSAMADISVNTKRLFENDQGSLKAQLTLL